MFDAEGHPTQRAKDECFVLSVIFEILQPLDDSVIQYDRILSRLSPSGAASLSLYREAVRAVQRAGDAELRLAIQYIERARELGDLPPASRRAPLSDS